MSNAGGLNYLWQVPLSCTDCLSNQHLTSRKLKRHTHAIISQMVTVAYAIFFHSGPVQVTFSSMEDTDKEKDEMI